MILSNDVVYFQFAGIVEKRPVEIKVSDITKQTWADYHEGITNLFRDYIDSDLVQNTSVKVDFGNGDVVDLYMPDMFINIIMWYPLVALDIPITGEHLFFPKEFTRNEIKKFYDEFIIERYRKTVDNVLLNRTLDDAGYKFIELDDYSMYLANTINIKDTIMLMENCKRFDEILHVSLKNRPMEEVKEIGMKLTYEAIDIIKDAKKYMGYEHCLRNPFMAHEGINDRQFKEFMINIGSKPNGLGGVHPSIIDGSYLGGALNNIESQFIDSAASRVAQIQTKQNTGDSGSFARILGLNNIDADFYPDLDYDCHTRNYLHILVKSEKHLNELIDKYYRLTPDGIQRCITKNDKHLIGQWIYLRSPITCASAARGHGVCRYCYGEMAYTNRYLKPGKFAAEKLSSEITQRQLSAKHLLETIIKALNWYPGFDKFLMVNMNIIQLNTAVEIQKDTFLIINPDDVNSVNSDDYEQADYASGEAGGDDEYNDYIISCYINSPDGNVKIGTKDGDRLYLSTELKSLMNDKSVGNMVTNKDGLIYIDLFKLNSYTDEDFGLFVVDLNNNELSKTLNDIENILNLKEVVSAQTKDSMLQNMIDLVIEGNLHIMSVHLEMLIMNQIRDADDIMEMPDWSIPDAKYQILRLETAIMNSPSITVTLLFQNLSKVLYWPQTFKKHKPSRLDLFFMERPQDFLNNRDTIEEVKPVSGKIQVIKKYRVKGEK